MNLPFGRRLQAQSTIVIGVLLGGVLLACKVCAEDDPTTTAEPAEITQRVDGASDAAPPSGDEGKNCSWSCLRWDKLCNVDRRGIYKCRRMCAEFGEVCE